MPANLTAIPFTKDDLDAVADFDCGDEPWAQYVSDWIKGGPGGVLDALEAGTEVWLYVNDQNEIVGYGSLGTTNWYYPDPYGREANTKRVSLSIIPAYAVQKAFHKKPAGAWQQHYSSKILLDLLNQALQRCQQKLDLAPLLGLFVDDRNLHAIRHYENHGFTKYGKPLKGRGQRMLLNLPVAISNTPEARQQETNFEQAASMTIEAPPLPEEQAKRDAAKARRVSHKRQRTGTKRRHKR
jgi:hypothetical protein